MSIITIDNHVFEAANSITAEKKPFNSKQWLKIEDSNSGGSYTNAQLVFETSRINNTGAFINFAEGYLSFPIVAVLSGVHAAGAVNLAAEQKNDMVMALKNSAMGNIIHNVNIEVENKLKYSVTNYANQYINFLLNTTLSAEEEEIIGPTIGYAADNSSSWFYCAVDSQAGLGLCNNVNNKIAESNIILNDTCNDGMLKRQKHFSKTTTLSDTVSAGTRATAGKEFFVNPSYTDDTSKSKIDGANIIVDHNNKKILYYDCIVPLKYLCPSLFGYDGLGLIRNANVRITLTVNAIVEFKFAKYDNTAASGGFLTYYENSYQNLSASETNMWMVASGTHKYHQTSNLGDPAVDKTLLVDCGSSALPILTPAAGTTVTHGISTTGTLESAGANYYLFSAKLVSNGDYTHAKPRCTLNLPAYNFQASVLAEYIGEGSTYMKRLREINVLNVWYKMFTASKNANFTHTVCNSVTRPKRLIMIAQIADGQSITAPGGGANDAKYLPNVLKSPFWTSAGHTCPFTLSQFQCMIGGRPVYNVSADNYSYKTYVAELNGAQGLSGGQFPGMISSRINFQDYNSLYHYIVVDLSRRDISVEDTPVSIEVSGKIDSNLNINFFCYVEHQEIFYIDISNGAIVDKDTFRNPSD